MKDAARKCICKKCGKELDMFVNADGKLVFFPGNTVRPADGFFELAYHLRHFHRDLYDLLILAEKRKSAIMEEYDISAVHDARKVWSA